ncbi:uncharacterized protein N7484_009446 [Penicillium longicatenatum]|uniref:uncharacterized protein n=1 Tax=Penicillium longicatenatum TaxID=1561947 RepID=UPI002548304F|nr:uncharacterized protein N7484_009446 [Penicillium longicatenatum]KAJ5636133.1 hypothetical protein N7484_009446 [Penicillium longicatenatum]
MTQDPGSSNPPDEPTKASAMASAELHKQCMDLLNDLDSFQALLKATLRNPQLVEVRQFRSNVSAEMKMLLKLEERIKSQVAKSKKNAEESCDNELQGGEQSQLSVGECQSGVDPDVEMRLMHALRSSNLPFYQAVWGIVLSSCEGLLAMGKRFYWDGETKAPWKKGVNEKQANKDKRKSIFVDIVAGDGTEWVKVSTISESRLLFEMAKKGWEADSEDEFSGSGSEGPARRTVLRNFDGEDPGQDDDDDDLELIKLARDLRKAADATRVRYRHPRLRIVLPKIEEGNVPEIDDILAEMRSYGIQVECQDSLSAKIGSTDLTRLLPQPFKHFTSILNVDCTLLLAMVSDLSHIKNLPILPSFHRAIVRQIEVDKEMPLLPSELWPAMGSRELVCTSEAGTRMREIVNLLGTDTEKARMRIVMGDPSEDGGSESLIKQFQALSDHHVPNHWKLPVRVIDAQPVIDAGLAEGKLPRVADEVAEGLSDINYSVFMYGWVTGTTTITSNRTIDKQIETTIEKNRDNDEGLEGPLVWVCDTARSLVGKDRDRKD